jgi:hypothetical protein
MLRNQTVKKCNARTLGENGLQRLRLSQNSLKLRYILEEVVPTDSLKNNSTMKSHYYYYYYY